MTKATCLIALSLAVATLFGCSQNVSRSSTNKGAATNPNHTENNTASVARININDANALLKSGSAVLLDARAESAYKVSHIKDSISMPEALIPTQYTKLPKDKKIITYCT